MQAAPPQSVLAAVYRFGGGVHSALCADNVDAENALGLCAVFLALFVVTLLAAFFCYEVPFGSLLMCMTCAYVMQHFAYCLSNCVLIICGLNSDIYGIYTDEVIIQEYFNILDVFGYIISFVIYYLTYWLFYLFFVRRIKRGVAPRLKNRSLLPSAYARSFFR